MRRFALSFAALSLSLAVAPAVVFAQAEPAAPATPTPDTKPLKGVSKVTKKQVYDANAVGKDQIASALASAKKENRRVLIQWGANWCGWCILLHDLCLTDKEVARKLMYEYDVVHIDIGDDWTKHADLAQQYGADLKGNGVPYWTVLDADGKVLANQDTGSLEAEGYKFGSDAPSHDTKKLMEFLTRHQAPYRSADSVLSDALTKAKEERKTVLLHFGAPWCGWCHKFEKWLAMPDVAEALAKDFVDVKIDTDRTLGGKEMLEHYAKRNSTGIPWFVLLDGEGEVLATSDDKDGNNIGCPVTDEEIAHFRDMLAKTAKHLSEEDITAITAKLQAKDEKAAAH